MIAAVENPSYATNLLVCRGTPAFLEPLLARPPSRSHPQPALGDLLLKSAEALWRWGRTGFARVDDGTLRRRLEACDSCPNLSAPPADRRALYALAGTAAGTRSVCRLCGCPVTRKAAMPAESCPDPHPANAGKTRWNEPSPPIS